MLQSFTQSLIAVKLYKYRTPPINYAMMVFHLLTDVWWHRVNWVITCSCNGPLARYVKLWVAHAQFSVTWTNASLMLNELWEHTTMNLNQKTLIFGKCHSKCHLLYGGRSVQVWLFSGETLTASYCIRRNPWLTEQPTRNLVLLFALQKLMISML